MLIAFHKPYGVLSQFSPDGSRHRTLAEFDLPSRVYPIGRLDADSEGLLLLSDEPECRNTVECAIPFSRDARANESPCDRICVSTRATSVSVAGDVLEAPDALREP